MKDWKAHLIISLIGGVLLIPFIGQVHLFDWDEINFAESAREMLLTGNFRQVMIDYEPFWEKPPLFFWIQALFMKIFGISEFSARLPNALVGIVTLNCFWYFGKKWYNEKVASLWILLYLGALTPFFYFKSGIIDPLFNLLIVLSLVQIHVSKTDKGYTKWLMAGLFLGLAVLTKGPVAVLIVLLVFMVMLALDQFKIWFKWKEFVVGLLVALAVTSTWFIPEIIHNGFGFLSNFIEYQLDLLRTPVASHGQPWYYHSLVLLLFCFPLTLLAFPYLWRDKNTNDGFNSLMKALFWVVLILFSIVETKIVHYSSLCYIPLSFIGAKAIGSDLIKKWVAIPIALIGLILTSIFAAIPFLGYQPEKLMALLDGFGTSGDLAPYFQLENPWNGYEGLLAALFLCGLVLLLFGLAKLNMKLIGVGLLLNVLFYNLYLANVVPKIERYTQGAMIDWYKTMEGKDAYIIPYKYKTYAHLYYAKTQPLGPEDSYSRMKQDYLSEREVHSSISLDEEGRRSFKYAKYQFLLEGELNKDVYFICPLKKVDELKERSDLKLVHETPLFKVFVRYHSS